MVTAKKLYLIQFRTYLWEFTDRNYLHRHRDNTVLLLKSWYYTMKTSNLCAFCILDIHNIH